MQRPGITISAKKNLISDSFTMPNDVSYNQLISLRGPSIKCYALLESHMSEGKLILIIGNNKKTSINGKDIMVTGQKKCIQEIVALAAEKGFDIL